MLYKHHWWANHRWNNPQLHFCLEYHIRPIRDKRQIKNHRINWVKEPVPISNFYWDSMPPISQVDCWSRVELSPWCHSSGSSSCPNGTGIIFWFDNNTVFTLCLQTHAFSCNFILCREPSIGWTSQRNSGNEYHGDVSYWMMILLLPISQWKQPFNDFLTCFRRAFKAYFPIPACIVKD